MSRGTRADEQTDRRDKDGQLRNDVSEQREAQTKTQDHNQDGKPEQETSANNSEQRSSEQSENPRRHDVVEDEVESKPIV